jgi:hypothetical protein
VGWIKISFIPFFIGGFIFILMACEPEVEKPATDSNYRLSFSADTVFFDTVFTDTRSITKRFKVYNQASGAVTFNKIYLQEGELSPFSIYINGEKGTSFEQVQLLGGDSLLILVEAKINRQDENLPFVVEDKLFITNGESYSIPVIAWGQDAIFIKGSILPCDAIFTADKPYVLFGSVLVDTLCSLTVDPGARIYNHFNSTLFVKGSLKINGTAENRVLFSNNRFEKNYRNAPGQWRGIYLLEGSFDNKIVFTDIRNADVGIRIGNPDSNDDFDLEIGHTKIENISTAGILSFTSDVFVYNSLINNCGMASIAGVAGGNYRIWNSTLANFSFDFFREDATLILADNVVLGDNSLLVRDLKADIKNNIIWGSLQEELTISNTEDRGDVEVIFKSNTIRTSSDTLKKNNLINIDPLFLEPSDYNYQLDSASAAINAGIELPGITTDLEGKTRQNGPDLGAFENQ